MDKVNAPRSVTRKERKQLRGRMGNFLMFLPNMVMLLGRLLRDVRVPTAEKALFVAAAIYVISPIDLIPDIFPFIGQVDDIYMVALTLLRLLNRTDETVVRQHWHGGGDIVSLAKSIASVAPKFLPQRVSRVLSSRVELAPAGKMIKGITNRDEQVVVAVDEAEARNRIKVDSRSAMTN